MRSRAYAGFFTAAALALSFLLVPKIAAAADHLNYNPADELYVGEFGFSCPTGFSLRTVASIENPVPAGAFLLGGVENGGGIDDNPISLTIPTGPVQSVDITVTDDFLGGDAYQVIVDGVLVGTTPLVTITGSPPPTPPFTVTVPLDPGVHTIDIHDALFSFIPKEGEEPIVPSSVPPFPLGSLNPVPSFYSPAALDVAATCVAHPGCSLTQDDIDTISAALPPEFDYVIFERIGPTTEGEKPGICVTSTNGTEVFGATLTETTSPTVRECDPDPASANACSTGDPFQGLDSVSIATSGEGTCDRVCKSIGGRRRCFQLCD